MKKKSMIWLFSAIAVVLAAVLVLLAVWGLKPSPKLNNLHTFCYPGLEWGMTMEEASEALGVKEGNFRETMRQEQGLFTHITVPVSNQEFLEMDYKRSTIMLRFIQFAYTEEPLLAGVILPSAGTYPIEETQEEYVGRIEDWLKEQGAEYTIQMENQKENPDQPGRYIGENNPRYASVESDPRFAMITVKSKADMRDQPEKYQKGFSEIHNYLLRNRIIERPEDWSMEKWIDISSSEERFPLVTVRADYLFQSENTGQDRRGVITIEAWGLAYLVAYSKK